VTARIFFSLSALAANLLASAGSGASPVTPDSLPRLLSSVIPHAISAAEHTSAAPDLEMGTTSANLALESFVPLWLVATFLAICILIRRRQRVPLRC
jgi:hypothetical protein